MRKYFLLIIVLLLFHACLNRFSKYNYVNIKKLNAPLAKTKLTSSVVIGGEKIKRLTGFQIINNYIIIIDSKSDKTIEIFDLKSRKLIKRFGRKGQGPSEFIGVSNIISDPNDKNGFWVCDLTARKLKKFCIEDVLNNNFSPKKIVSFKQKIFPDIIVTNNNEIIGLSRDDNKRINIYNMKGEIIRTIGKIPVKLKNNKFSSQHQHGFWSDIIYRKEKGEIFVATKYGSIIEKYNCVSGKLLATYYGPELFFPHYNIVFAGSYYTITMDKNSRLGYLGIEYNKKTDKIFLLYSGKYYYDRERHPTSDPANIVYIINGNTQISEELLLDKGIWDFKVSEDGSVIYGAGENEILKFVYGKTQ